MELEIIEVDGKRLAEIAFLFLFIPSFISLPIALLLLALGVEIEGVGGLFELLGVYALGILGLFSVYMTVRLQAWIYNRIARRFGGLKYRVAGS